MNTTKEDDQPVRQVSPLKGLLILAGSFGSAAAATWLASRALPLPQGWTALGLASDSDGLWFLLGGTVFFPAGFGLCLVLLAKGAERKPLLRAYAAGVYIVACTAELYVRGVLSLWPEILSTALACAALGAFLPPSAPEDPQNAED